MADTQDRLRFERLALPHLDAAYNLARWLTHNEHDAQDVVQDAMLRAMRYIGSCRGDDAKAWLLQIVRNTCFDWLKKNRPSERLFFDDEDEMLDRIPAPGANEPHTIAVRNEDKVRINEAIASLPAAYRDVIVLRELEDLSYADIARIANVPVGTVMSRLARARGLLRLHLVTRDQRSLRLVFGDAKYGS
jgi:RNA polymerase sigma-70 factor (ECF subfamily)